MPGTAILLAFVAALGGPQVLFAQAAVPPRDTGAVSILRLAAARGWKLRIVSGDSSAIGRVNEVTSTEIRMVGQRVPLAGLSRIERETRSSGAIVPLAAGGAVAIGFLFHAFAAGMCDSQDCAHGAHLEATFAGVGLGGMLGAAIGGSVGRRPVKWITLWPR